jgi:segregation and condensation protein A
MSQAPPDAQERSSDGLEVHLTSFHGSLELLLHLVRTGAIDLQEVPILDIARQYDAYVESARHGLLELKGDYLVQAASLAHMKSRRLLPADPSLEGFIATEDDLDALLPETPGVGLRRAAEHLQEREALMELVFPRPADRVAEFAGEQGIEADLFALLRAFQAILKRVGENPSTRVTRERISLAEKITWLVETLQRDRRVAFRALFEDAADRMACILTFLALLEVMRLRLARAYQSHRESDILIVLAEETPPPAADTLEPQPHA